MQKRYNYAVWDNGEGLIVGIVTGGDPLSVTLQPIDGNEITVPRSSTVTRNGTMNDVRAAHIIASGK